jgi:DNA processing protein
MNNQKNSISHEFIALTLMLPKIGRKTAFKIFNNLKYKITNYEDLLDYINECNNTLKTPSVSLYDFENAKEKTQKLKVDNEKHQINMVSYYDETYPSKFCNESDAPILLYYKGNKKLFNHNLNVGIIGTREAYEQALQMGKKVSRTFAENGFNIVSGLAKGCDAAAHLGATEANGLTTAFLAHGLQMIYPKENSTLAQKILDNNGLLVSEYPTGSSPIGNFFVERDRLQAYLSDLLIVIQTDIKGGTMHAVGTIVKSKKTLAAIYPDLNSFREHPKSRGNEYLIKEMGAIPLVVKEDIENLIKKWIPAAKSYSEKNDSMLQEVIQDSKDLEVKYELKKDPITLIDKIENGISKVEKEYVNLNQQPISQNDNMDNTTIVTLNEIKEELKVIKTSIDSLRIQQETILNYLNNIKKKERKIKTSTKDENSQSSLL